MIQLEQMKKKTKLHTDSILSKKFKLIKLAFTKKQHAN